jgi:dihydrofolate reductase
MTEIEADPDGDTWFPSLDPGIWVETSRNEIDADPRDEHRATLIIYDRIV